VKRAGNSRAERPPGFTYVPSRSGLLRRPPSKVILHSDKIPLSRVAARFGTPVYVYSAIMIRERVRAFSTAFRGFPHTICYSVKANSNIHILRVLRKLGCGFDVVSGGELQRVLIPDRSAADSVVFSGVGKRTDEMELALKAGILLFNIESESELEALAGAARRLKRMARIAFRVNPDVPAKTHPYVSTGLQEHKFGVPISEARRLYRQAAAIKRLTIAGVSVHIGSQITDVEPFTLAMERVADLVSALRVDGHQIKYVDAGGGLGIDYESEQSAVSEQISSYAAAITKPLRNLKVHVLLEPGRSIVGPAGVLLTEVIYLKKSGRKRFVVVDAAMNDLIRPALYKAYHEIALVEIDRSADLETVDVVGPVCETGDFFARNRNLPALKQGDLLAIMDAGAYGMSLASNYNTRLRPAEVLVDGRSMKLIRRRETIDDLLRQEV